MDGTHRGLAPPRYHSDRRLAGGRPLPEVPRHRQPATLAPGELGVGLSLSQGVSEVQGGVDGTEHSRLAVPGGVPVPGHEAIPGVPEEELGSGDTGVQSVAVFEEAARLTVQADLFDAGAEG